jgi:hypothetical protein
MTALLIIFGILGAISLLMFFVKRQEEKEQKRRKQVKEAARAQISAPAGSGSEQANELMRIQVGDAVSITGDTYTVKQKLIFREGNFEWVEYKIMDGETTRWLEVEDDDELWLAVYEEVEDLKIKGEPPDEIEYHGVEFELDEKGYATMRKAGEPESSAPEMRYFDYEGDGDEVLSIEQWGDNFEVSVGHRVSPHALEVYSAGGKA